MTPTIVLTGASDGIGAAAARRLKSIDAHLVLVGRSPAKTQTVAEEVGADWHVVDYTQLADVRRLASVLQRYDRIDVLANNAGGIMGEREVTADGFEKTFQVNHLAPFLLTHMLVDTLKASRASIVQTSSVGAHALTRGLDLDDLNHERKYSHFRAYGDSKLANVLFTRELDRRYAGDGISAVSFHPGNIASNFGSESTRLIRTLLFKTPVSRLLSSPEIGARRLTDLALGRPGTDWERGAFYENDKRADQKIRGGDEATCRAFWERSEHMLAEAGQI